MYSEKHVAASSLGNAKVVQAQDGRIDLVAEFL
jgi:hypothetical protein